MYSRHCKSCIGSHPRLYFPHRLQTSLQLQLHIIHTLEKRKGKDFIHESAHANINTYEVLITRRRKNVLDKDKDGFLSTELNSLADDINKLPNSQIGRN